MVAFACAVDGIRWSCGALPGNARRAGNTPLPETILPCTSPRLPGCVPRGTGMTRVVALANQKGGVGKTTTAINLGASLAACERRVLLIDLDPQANATSGVGLVKNEAQSMYPVLLDGMSIRSVIRPTELPTPHLAPSSVDLVGAEIELSGTDDPQFRLRKAIEPISTEYDYILID